MDASLRVSLGRIIAQGLVPATAALSPLDAVKNLAALQAIEKGKEHYHEAHLAHRKLVQQEAQGDKVWMSLLLSHAEDLLMSADIMSELAKEFQGLYEEIQAIKQTIQSTGS